MSIQPARITRQTALEAARALIGTTYASTQDAETSFNGWTLIARCFGGKALTFAPGWGPRERSIALNTFLGRGMAPITLAQAKPGDVLVFNMGRDGFHAAILSDVSGPEPKMISCQHGRAVSESWVGKFWTDKLVGVFTTAPRASTANDNALTNEAA
ncbi:C40 family peptidase [Brevundimonas aurantiaca]|uniref:C40 family peptidase n=1 Tax=Brevundimonas aurantiaca TaxID=74316 RepID=UPI001D184A3F|nr:C40 family peptidase [Brevundimonas aurantiaca]MCC4295824.1 C40 family peptidase [Brevundimonas aurantiaca]